MRTVTVTLADRARDDLRNSAARIWAHATARRDGDRNVAPLRDARALIDAILDSSPAAMLLVATDEVDDATVGFAVISPDAHGDAEVRYLGVWPEAWGQGVATNLLQAMPAFLTAAGFTNAVLSVYVDNARAVAAYLRAGWEPTGDRSRHPRTGRVQERYRVRLPPFQ